MKEFTPLGALVLRVVLGIIMAAHGWQKVFSMGVDKLAGFFGSMGIPFPSIAAPGVAWLELVGGVLIIIGLFTRPIALLLAVDMLVAVALAHFAKGFFMPQGYEFTLLLFAASAYFLAAGGGAYSADHLVAGQRQRNA